MRLLSEQVLQWTREWGRAQQLAHRIAVIFSEEVEKVSRGGIRQCWMG